MKQHKITLLFCIFLIAMPIVFAGSWSGYVVNINDSSPIALVTVTARNIDTGMNVNNALTDTGGYFYVGDLPVPGNYTLLFSKNGYTNTSYSGAPLTITKPDRYINPAVMNIIMSTALPGNLIGKVTSGTTQLNNVNVTLWQNNNIIASTLTNSAGDFTINNLVDGSYTIEANAGLGYVTQNQTTVIIQGATTNVNFNLQVAPGSVSGYVLSESNNPIIGANIQINSQPYSTLTDNNGYYIISNIPVGTYTITETAVGFTQKSSSLTINPGTLTQINFSYLPVIPSGGSSGSGGGSHCTPEWNCTEWTFCNSTGIQTRKCTDIKYCFTQKDKPAQNQICSLLECTKDSDCNTNYQCKYNKCMKKVIPENKTIEEEQEETQETNLITGFSILDFATKLKNSAVATLVLAIFIGILSGLAVFTYLRRKY